MITVRREGEIEVQILQTLIVHFFRCEDPAAAGAQIQHGGILDDPAVEMHLDRDRDIHSEVAAPGFALYLMGTGTGQDQLRRGAIVESDNPGREAVGRMSLPDGDRYERILPERDPRTHLLGNRDQDPFLGDAVDERGEALLPP